MAQYMVVLVRNPQDLGLLEQRMKRICVELTPALIQDRCSSIVAEWPGVSRGLYGIQNSEGIDLPNDGALVIGWIADPPEGGPASASIDADGSYAVVKVTPENVSFFVDQFGSRTLWYYHDDGMLVVSTSQRAVVGLKGSFLRNDEAMAWFLSSGCQGPFISWDQEIRQVRPDRDYVFDVGAWTLHSRGRPGMELPVSGSIGMDGYLRAFERQVSSTLSKMVRRAGSGRTLLPLSGGLDSRLLLGLCRHEGLGDEVSLVNWGVPVADDIFDDKAAASQIARAFGMPLMEMELPAASDNHDEVLQNFVRESEGRVDHFNAYTDGFAMWAEFFNGGFRQVLRGDLPYRTGLDLDEYQFRARIGVEPFTDYANWEDFYVGDYARLQVPYDISRQHGESLMRWRDRLYVQWRMPLVLSAFTDFISAYVENRTPMVNWTLYRQYSGLPDTSKGNKPHIRALWEKHDRSGVPRGAVGSLRSPDSFFSDEAGANYLRSQLQRCDERGDYAGEMIAAVKCGILRERASQHRRVFGGILGSARRWASGNLPEKLKARIKSRRVKRLSATTLAYRMILGAKVIGMYQAAASVGRGTAR